MRVCLHATVCALTTDLGGTRVVEARIGTPNGRWHRVRAKTFVVACGTIENTRLLLASGVGNSQVGCCFMEHPRDYALTVIPERPELLEQCAFYDAHRAAGNSFVGGRLALTEHAVRVLGHPNASLTLLPRLRKGLAPEGLAERLAQRLKSVLSASPQEGYGWSRVPNPARFFDGFRVLTNLEQRPHPENRITLGPKRDALGMPRSRLQWRWRSEEQAELSQLRREVVSCIQSSGLGRVEIDSGRPVDPNAHHHSGTTRMAVDPRDGVVDADGRVHGVRNLFVAGASVFPTCGFANPTLTVVALALRLADHLKARG
ncbi:MAG TPA: GMC oxidoreductase [Gemmatimonadales bacterium]|nr:GMC oxidoreductase [Gemmatimonadales bacterium]